MVALALRPAPLLRIGEGQEETCCGGGLLEAIPPFRVEVGREKHELLLMLPEEPFALSLPERARTLAVAALGGAEMLGHGGRDEHSSRTREQIFLPHKMIKGRTLIILLASISDKQPRDIIKRAGCGKQ